MAYLLETIVIRNLEAFGFLAR